MRDAPDGWSVKVILGWTHIEREDRSGGYLLPPGSSEASVDELLATIAATEGAR